MSNDEQVETAEPTINLANMPGVRIGIPLRRALGDKDCTPEEVVEYVERVEEAVERFNDQFKTMVSDWQDYGVEHNEPLGYFDAPPETNGEASIEDETYAYLHRNARPNLQSYNYDRLNEVSDLVGDFTAEARRLKDWVQTQ